MKKQVYHNSFFLLACGLAWLLGLFWVLSHTKLEQMQWINTHRRAWSDGFFWGATQLGEGWCFAAVILIAAAFSYYRSVEALVALGISTAFSQGLKHIFATPRPQAFFADLPYAWHYVKGVEIHLAYSFPSGHTTTVFCICALLSCWTSHKPWTALLVVPACITAYSRSYLFQHFPEDLLGGAIVGIISAFLACWLVEKYFSPALNRWEKVGFFRSHR